MKKVIHVAWREFTATVLTKGFLIGVFLVPLIGVVAIPAAILLVNMKPPPVQGTVAFIDRTGSPEGLVIPELRQRFTPEALARRVSRTTREAGEQAARELEKISPGQGQAARSAVGYAESAAVADVPRLEVEILPADADLEAAKQALLEEGGEGRPRRLALVVIDPDAVHRAAGSDDFGSFQMFVRAKLDARVQALIRAQVREAVLQTRLEANGMEPAAVRALTRIEVPDAVAVTRAGEKATSEFQQMLLPLAFMMLLWISVFTGGQFLLTSTIEEKSNRIMEVLLSAVSPLHLMTGKIIGQMAAALVILVVYSGLGIVALLVMARMDLVDWWNLLLLGVFFLLAFFMIASMMAAIGSAVTDIHEAQTLMTPIMIIVMLPMLLMMPIIWNPDSLLATTLSFIPPINPFVMVLRLSSSTPPPLWQTLLSVAVGVVGVIVLLKVAAKVFRIGVLMYGKPPNFATLVRWVRMA
jgi:ABC-2 type transport system permease protein